MCLFWKNKGRELKQMLYSTFQLSSGGLRGERPILGWKSHQARGLTDLSDKLLISALLEQMNNLRLDSKIRDTHYCWKLSAKGI